MRKGSKGNYKMPELKMYFRSVLQELIRALMTAVVCCKIISRVPVSEGSLGFPSQEIRPKFFWTVPSTVLILTIPQNPRTLEPRQHFNKTHSWIKDKIFELHVNASWLVTLKFSLMAAKKFGSKLFKVIRIL